MVSLFDVVVVAKLRGGRDICWTTFNLEVRLK
jgi:hypothetical protein